MCDRDTMSYEKCKDCEFRESFYYSDKGKYGCLWICKVTREELDLKHCPKKPCGCGS